MPSPTIASFGCRLNLVESEAVRAAATRAGIGDALVVNTCAVTAEAVRQARQAIRRHARLAPGAPIYVTGCAAQSEPATFAAMPEVTGLVGNAAKGDPAAWVLARRAPSHALAPWREGPARPIAGADAAHTRKFLAVQTGCDHDCTFCVIPRGRGPSRSVPAAAAVEAAGRLREAGAQEIVLTGVDITAWGADLPGRPTLGALVNALLNGLPDLPRLRLSSLDCVEADAALLEAFASEPRLMPHMHLSLQAGHDLTLKRMKRRHGRADAVALCQALRARRPDLVFGADLIAGFPTETEAMFEATLALVEDCGLTHLHVFPFSPRPGTAAARMPPVPGDVSRARAARLRALGEARRAAHFQAQVGRTLPLLMERGGLGRAPDFSPVRVEGGQAGALIRARVVAYGADGLAGVAA